jgi:hypothetical protein
MADVVFMNDGACVNAQCWMDCLQGREILVDRRYDVGDFLSAFEKD